MHITSKGQVTIPLEIRTRLGLLPNTEVEFELSEDHARIRKAAPKAGSSRGERALAALRRTGDIPMTTDQIMVLTRGASRARRKSR
jgi:AbrB family looped-hinge helix DNA binding protein